MKYLKYDNRNDFEIINRIDISVFKPEKNSKKTDIPFGRSKKLIYTVLGIQKSSMLPRDREFSVQIKNLSRANKKIQIVGIKNLDCTNR